MYYAKYFIVSDFENELFDDELAKEKLEITRNVIKWVKRELKELNNLEILP
jgi:hypothetical protein